MTIYEQLLAAAGGYSRPYYGPEGTEGGGEGGGTGGDQGDGGGGERSGDGGGEGSGGTGGDGGGTGGSGASDGAVERPDYLPEKFWKDGAANVEALATGYTKLERTLGQRVTDLDDDAKRALVEMFPENLTDTMRAQLREELAGDIGFQNELTEKLGLEKPAEAPETYATPETPGFKIDEQAEDYVALQTMAKEGRWSQETFDAVVQMGARLMAVEPLPQRRMEIDNFAQRAQQATNQALNVLPDDLKGSLDSFRDLIKTPEQFRVFEALVDANAREGRRPTPNDTNASEVTQEAIDKLMLSPEYQRGDKAVHARVQAMYQQLHGGRT